MPRTHHYAVTTTWTGDRGTGTSGYRDFDRDHESVADGRPPLLGSSDPGFRGDPARWNPELLLVAALSRCHMLWYLHLCAEAGIVVVGYRDATDGEMEEDGSPPPSGETTRSRANGEMGQRRLRRWNEHLRPNGRCSMVDGTRCAWRATARR